MSNVLEKEALDMYVIHKIKKIKFLLKLYKA